MIIDCPIMEPYRSACDLAPFINLYKSLKPQYSSVKIFAMYLNDRDPTKIQKKTLSLCSMKLGWHKLMNINI